MAGLSLSYCQLIKIVLSQIGGSPLKQVYTQLSQGAKQITTGSGVIPNALTEVKAVIDQITNTINSVTGQITSAQQMMEKVAQQFYQNPMGAVIDTQIDVVDVRITKITIRQQDIVAYENVHGNNTATPAPPYTDIATEKQKLTDEKSSLQLYRAKLVQYKTNTDLLSGVSTLSGSEAAGGCSLQDLLGSGCTPNDAVPDIDLKNLIDSLKQGDLMKALTEKIINATGYADYEIALNSLSSTVSGFIDSFNNSINKAAIRNAIQAQITQIVFNLLSGCSGSVYDLTLRPNVKSAISGYVSLAQAESEGKVYVDPNGNVTTTQSVVDATTTTTTTETGVLDDLPTVPVDVITAPVATTEVTPNALGPVDVAKVEDQTSKETTAITKTNYKYTAKVQLLYYDKYEKNTKVETINFGGESLASFSTSDSIEDYLTNEVRPVQADAFKITVYQLNKDNKTYSQASAKLVVDNPSAIVGDNLN